MIDLRGIDRVSGETLTGDEGAVEQITNDKKPVCIYGLTVGGVMYPPFYAVFVKKNGETPTYVANVVIGGASITIEANANTGAITVTTAET